MVAKSLELFASDVMPTKRTLAAEPNPHNRGPEARTPRGSRRTSVDVENGRGAPFYP